VERAIEIRAIAGFQEASGPDVEHRTEIELRHRVQDFDLVGDAVVVGIEHELYVFSDRSIDVDAGVIESELVVSPASAGGIEMVEAGLQSGPNRNRAKVDLRP